MTPGGSDAARVARPRVIYIGGMGRSGSTLLERLLTGLPGFVGVGELRYLWEQGLQQNLLCSCGASFYACPFWAAVGDQAFGGWDNVDLAATLRLKDGVDRHRYIPLLTRSRASGAFSVRAARYGGLLERIYAAVASVSGQSVIVDSSKDPPFAFVLRRWVDVDFRLVHLVRDSRGVAYSWAKHTRRPEVQDHEAFMARYSSLNMSLRWIDYNLLFHFLAQLGTPAALVYYEQLVTQPAQVLARVVRLASTYADEALTTALSRGDVAPPIGHSVAGNRVRFDRGPLKLAADVEWHTRMQQRDRLLVGAVTAPLLLRYGYVGPRSVPCIK